MLNTTTREGKIQNTKTYISILDEMIANSYEFPKEHIMEYYSQDKRQLSESYKEKDTRVFAS